MSFWRSVILYGGFCITSVAHARDPRCNKSIDLVQPRHGIVNNAQTASAIALAYLMPIYGDAQIRRQLPLRATLHDEEWLVEGVLPPGSIGGNVQIMLCQRNGTVLRIIYSK